MSSPGSCARCNRPLPADPGGELCPACLATAGVPPEPATASLRPATGRTATLQQPLARHTPVEDGTTRSDSEQTRTPLPLAAIPLTRDQLPEPPPGYDLVRQLGEGGMGTVYLAREHAAERTVAIKFLNYPTSTTAFDRFLNEARSLARLDHPNVVRVFHVETNWREPFLTMEYADAGTLADLVKPNRPLPDPAEAARLVLAAAEAVAAAHAAGVLHRDLKPSNILLHGAGGEGPGARGEESGAQPLPPRPSPPAPLTPKVSDFGLSKLTDQDRGLTQTGPIGTPCYMSPEAAAGRFREVGPAADVYGLGATLYHLLTGRPPFTGGGTDEIMRRVVAEPPARPRAVRPEVPAGLEAVVVKALEKDPAARYPGAEALAADLRRFLAGEAPAAPVLSPRRRAWRWLRRNRVRLALALVVVLLAAGLVGLGLWLARPDPLAPAPDPLDALRADFGARRPVELLREDGSPRWVGPRVGLASEGRAAAAGGAWAIESLDHALRDLSPPIPWERYRVRVELLQVRVAGSDDPAPKGVGTAFVGFYLGNEPQFAPDGTALHPLLAVTLRDYDGGAAFGVRQAKDEQAHFKDYTLYQRPEKLAQIPREPIATYDFRPAERQPGPWRTVQVDVTPDSFRPSWVTEAGAGKEFKLLTNGVTPANRQAWQQRRFDQYVPGSGLVAPGWPAPVSVGIWCYRAQVAVRRCTVSPLPEPRVP